MVTPRQQAKIRSGRGMGMDIGTFLHLDLLHLDSQGNGVPAIGS